MPTQKTKLVFITTTLENVDDFVNKYDKFQQGSIVVPLCKTTLLKNFSFSSNTYIFSCFLFPLRQI